LAVFDKWKKDDGEWGFSVVTFVAVGGVLLLVGLYYVLTNGLEKAVTERFNPGRLPAAITTEAGAHTKSLGTR
jgi:hypothetical protein